VVSARQKENGMKETLRPNKRAKGEGTIYQRVSDGYWCASVELPSPDGKRRRKVITAKSEAAVKAKLTTTRRELLKHGDLPTNSTTLASWLDVWFQNIAAKKNRPKTLAYYKTMIEQYIKPSIGRIPLAKLTPEHVRQVAAYIAEKGLSTTTAAGAHRTLAVALKYAEREGRVTKNVATLTDAPQLAVKTVKALTAQQGAEVILVAGGRVPYAPDPYASLWAAVLLTGARQGELLGMELDRVTDVLDLSWQLQRVPWSHGCDNTCDRKRGSDCPKRKAVFAPGVEHRFITGGLWWMRPKTTAGYRIIPLVSPLKEIIDRQLELYDANPNEYGLLWTTPTGQPIDPRDESAAWDALLKRAGVPDVRLHDGRHTTVDLLLAAGVPMDIITEIVGHSSRVTTEGYKSRGNLPRLTEAMKALSAQFQG
jgi:integrase